MFITYRTPIEIILSKLNYRVDKLYPNIVKGIYIEHFKLDSERKTIVLNVLTQEMLGETEYYTTIPIEISVKLLLKSGKVIPQVLNKITIDIGILSETEYELLNQRELRNLFEGNFTEIRYKMLLNYAPIFTVYGDSLTIPQCQANRFNTLSEEKFDDIANNYQSLNYVKKPSITDINNMLLYYFERDYNTIKLFAKIIKSVEKEMYARDWYLYRNLPIYRKQLPTKDKIFITSTFGILHEEDTNNIMILYDYKKKMSVEEVISVLEDFYIPFGDIELITTLYKYSLDS